MKTKPVSPRARQSYLRKLTAKIGSSANYSLAILGMAFVRHGSGKFLNLRLGPDKSRVDVI